MASTRRLTAILAADVAGYSRLMGADEEGTHERLKAHRRELVDPKINEHQGSIVKTTGDGLLAEFPSVVDAMRCAAEVQRGMIDREPEETDERQIRFRIGINLGDIIAEGGDIFGDGVNVAARLSRGTEGSNPAPSSGESVSLPELLSRVENPGFPRGCGRWLGTKKLCRTIVIVT
jgi:adenylate cyclase